MNVISVLEDVFEAKFGSLARWQLIAASASLTYCLTWIYEAVNKRDEIYKDMDEKMLKYARLIPSVKEKIDNELKAMRESIPGTLFLAEEYEIESFGDLPSKGLESENVLNLLKEILNMGKYDWEDGKISGGVFTGSSASYTSLMSKTYEKFALSNPLHQDIFPGVRKMEAEIVAMTSRLFHGDTKTVGCLTSGGSESLCLALKSSRDWGQSVKGIKTCEIVAPNSIHAAVDKFAHYLGMKLRKLPLDPVTFKASPKDYKKAINSNTVLLMCSAPDFSYGLIDDVESLSELALKKGILLHVDCCLGGYILPFMKEAGFDLPLFDFRLQGVTTISADCHKYGCSPKGSSVLLYRNKQLMHHQYFVFPDWPGGIYATATVPGSRPGAHIAMCWAAMMSHGREGYVQTTKKIIDVARYLKNEFAKIPHLRVNGDPLGPVISCSSDKINILQVCDILSKEGWHLQPLQRPNGMHIFLTSLHTRPGLKEELSSALRQAVDETLKNPGEAESGIAMLYAQAQSIPIALVKEASNIYQDFYYVRAQDLQMHQENLVIV